MESNWVALADVQKLQREHLDSMLLLEKECRDRQEEIEELKRLLEVASEGERKEMELKNSYKAQLQEALMGPEGTSALRATIRKQRDEMTRLSNIIEAYDCGEEL